MSIPAVDDRGPSTEPNAHFADSNPAPAPSDPSSIDNAPYKLLYDRWKMEAAKVERLVRELRSSCRCTSMCLWRRVYANAMLYAHVHVTLQVQLFAFILMR